MIQMIGYFSSSKQLVSSKESVKVFLKSSESQIHTFSLSILFLALGIFYGLKKMTFATTVGSFLEKFEFRVIAVKLYFGYHSTYINEIATCLSGKTREYALTKLQDSISGGTKIQNSHGVKYVYYCCFRSTTDQSIFVFQTLIMII